MKKMTLLLTLFLCGLANAYGQWTTIDLSNYRWQISSTPIGSKVYFAGGDSYVGILSLVQSYDVETGLWESTNMSVKRRFANSASSGSKLFVAGGLHDANQATDVVDIYDTLTKQWTVAQLSQSRFAISMVSKDGVVLFAGGGDFSLAPIKAYDVVDIYHTQSNSWTTAKLSLARAGMGSTVAGNKAFFAGGEVNSGAVTDRVDIYDFSTDSWSTATLSAPRFFIGVATVGNKILFAGGVDSDGIPTKRVDIYDLDSQSWSIDSLSVARGISDENVASVCGKAYFIGGVNLAPLVGQFSEDFHEIDIYDGESGTWSVDQLPYDLCLHSVSSIGNQILVAGGATIVGSNYQLRNKVSIFTDANCMVGTHTPIAQADFFQVYPNPTSGDVTVVLEGVSQADFRLFDAMGRILRQGQWSDESNTLNTAQLEPGVYRLLLITKGVYANQLIVVQ